MFLYYIICCDCCCIVVSVCYSFNFYILFYIIYCEEYIVNILFYDIYFMFDGKIIIFCINYLVLKYNMKFFIL